MEVVIIRGGEEVIGWCGRDGWDWDSSEHSLVFVTAKDDAFVTKHRVQFVIPMHPYVVDSCTARFAPCCDNVHDLHATSWSRNMKMSN